MLLKIFFTILYIFVVSSGKCFLIKKNTINGIFIPALTSKYLNGKIYGGNEIGIDKAPYQVALYWNNEFICGGAIISAMHILSAAHCIIDAAEYYTIGVGSSELYNTKKYEVESITIHPEYNHTTFSSDISILKLKYSLEINNSTVQIIELNKNLNMVQELKNGTGALVTGWGKTEFVSIYSNILHGVEVKIVARDTCQRIYDRVNIKITEDMLCAWDNKKDSCTGDSGGPLAINNATLLIGIVSWGMQCADPVYPGVYSNVTHSISFINSIITGK